MKNGEDQFTKRNQHFSRIQLNELEYYKHTLIFYIEHSNFMYIKYLMINFYFRTAIVISYILTIR